MGFPDALNIGFRVDSKKLWAVDIPIQEIPITELEHNLDIPYLEQMGTDDWNLTPRMLIENFGKETDHADRVRGVDMRYPIEIYLNRGNWIILDGVHRFTKAVMGGQTTVRVRVITPEIARSCKRCE